MIIKVLMYVGFSGYQYTSIIKLDNNLIQLKKTFKNICVEGVEFHILFTLRGMF